MTGETNADGTPRPSGAPQASTLRALSILDNGSNDVVVDSEIYRVGAGLRGKLGGDWTWDTAAFYTQAYSADISPMRSANRCCAPPCSALTPPRFLVRLSAFPSTSC